MQLKNLKPSKLIKIMKNKNLLKFIISTAVTAALTVCFQDIAFAEGQYKYKEPVNLTPVFEFVDWLIFIIRLATSTIIGLISTVAGYKWGTDISGSGQTEAKKILKNCAAGLFWVWLGSTIVSVFVNKLEEIVA